ncbi:LacI family transcriptional regulator [Prevotella cerevisiae]|jgi:DNA-binding LacI/PurR family transcriptional regulator|uniref:LacI family transcriptional regulator n=1 Tax=Segatella cerevisiae TaxID=2053716 RepID=A0ABT1BXA7_9BACT|nr:LacI family DNA-binding transcriptional regulator [Segatella cerevisiae]MCH3995241.1 LacI family transcriptional regulator [Prevotella sp.]MCO6025709.1 LacI family transcriptional regulator [Segatella cerevisiae]
MKEQKSITMKDIARNLGVSIATVSRALQDSPRISGWQRARIQVYAKEHNFYPNIIGAALRHSRDMPMKVIGVILPQFVHYYFSSVLTGIEEEARIRGYHIMVALSDEHYDREVEVCESFYKNKVCGIIVSQAKDTKKYDHFRKLMNHGVPLVFYDRICTGVNCSRVVVDDYRGAYMAVSHLIETGCKRIAFYGSSMNLEISKNRYNGYKDALLKHGLLIKEKYVRLCDNRSAAEEITPELLSMEDHPDAFFAVNDDTAIGALYTAKRMGFKVPDDISICGFTNGYRAEACDPMLTTVEQRGRTVGVEAANILIGLVEGTIPMDKIEKKIVPTRLIIRGSTR